MTSRTLRLDEIIDPLEARVLVTVDAAGAVVDARFDLAGLPRVDALMVGRPVAGVPALVERLCGLCPAAHHLAGVRALDALLGFGPLPPTADAVRRLLHHGAALDAHAPRFAPVDRPAALALRRFGRAALAAAGSPGHFPATAVPGGVRAPVAVADRDALAAALAEALGAAERLADRLAAADEPPLGGFDGLDLALVDDAGALDLLGARVRAVAADGTLVAEAAPGDWPAFVAEEVPGAAAPRPYLAALGPGRGRYRVGPVAQLRAGVLPTPLAATRQAGWAASGGGVPSARAVLALHSVEAIAGLLARPDLVAGPVQAEAAPPASAATGWVEGPRGLLAHSYAVDAAGAVSACRILTPTAQNEPWLAALLAGAARAGSDAGLEASIRAADPCLPCASAPAGAMGLAVTVVRPDGPPVNLP